MASMFSKS